MIKNINLPLPCKYDKKYIIYILKTKEFTQEYYWT